MSRGRSAEAARGVLGAVALPTPPGDVATIRSAARRLRLVADTYSQTATVRGTLARLLPQVWHGAAAEAAVAEAGELSRRAQAVGAGLPPAASALDRYADFLARVRVSVNTVQREWDVATTEHARAVVSLQLRAVGDFNAARAVARLEADHEATKSRLTRRHAALLDELAAAGRVTARAVGAASDTVFPSHRAPTAAGVRHHLVAGQGFAEGAVVAARTREQARADTVTLRSLISSASDGAAPGGDVSNLLDILTARASDPVYAQAVLDEIGVDGVHAAVTDLTRPGGVVPGPELDSLVGLLGSVLLTAAVPTEASRRDPRTRQQLVSNGTFVRESLLASVHGEYADRSGETRNAGYWLVGQLVVGARRAGWTGTIPPELLRSLTGGVAAAEIAETRDSDALRRHGTTVSPDGSHLFTSLVDDPDHSGDALHVLLTEAVDDPAENAALLATEVDGGILTNARGGALTLAEHLTRRWITYELNGPSTTTGLRLATNDDLVRLLRSAAAGGAEEAAALRARVMVEIARTNSFARQEFSTIHQYQRNTAAVESEAVDWVLAMRTSATQTLELPLFGRPDGWTTDEGTGPQPMLRTDELAALVGAFAVATDFGVGAKEPAADYARLLDGELAHARAAAGSGVNVDADVTRISFFETAAAAALTGLARQQDRANESMWQNLAEARNMAVGLLGGPGTSAAVVQSVLTGGTTRSATDDLVISLVRSNVELAQTEANEQRHAALLATLAGIRTMPPAGGVTVAELMRRGAAAAPRLPSSQPLREARTAEVAERLQTATESLAGKHLSPDGRKDTLERFAAPEALRAPVGSETSRGRSAEARVAHGIDRAR